MSEEKPRQLMATSSTAYNSFSDHHHHHHHHHMMLQSTFDQAPAEIYNSTANMEILGFPKGPSSSSSSHQFYNHQHDFTNTINTASYLHVEDDDPSLRISSTTCVFPCEGNERPSQGLSLSLSSSNPSSIGLQSFELRQNDVHREQFSIRNSRYLWPAQGLLNEFCNLGIKENDFEFKSKMKVKKTMSEFEGENISDIAQKQSLYSLDFLELQKRKTRLIQLLEEVDRRYKHYCNQMKGVVQPFEAVAGNGAGLVYSSMASRAMSRHFRCLKDGILNQIKATKKAMGDKDSGATLGTIKGETPRLRLLDQTLRQQKALQQMSFMESHPWRPQRGLPERSVSVLRAWLFEHFLHPYPSDVDKHILARQTGLSRSQVSNWFINARVRLWKPMVEEMYLEELKDQDPTINNNIDDQDNHNRSLNEDQKPTHDQLLVIDSESLSSIFNNPGKNEGKKIQTLGVNNSYGGAMDMDFSSSYDHHQSHGGGGVSLTLGLHQNGGNNASSSHGSFFYRDEMEDCQTVQYGSLLDSDQTQSNYLPYRNLMDAQLLHDLAG